MAFNKIKVLESAQKLLNQGKLAQAIVEYQQILRHEPNDQVTLMTIGDLYVRAGDTHQALDYFEKLAQLFLNDGFVSKAIAIYKKIGKLAPEETNPLERLGELYVQQGVMSEARPLYLQVAELHLKGNRSQRAVEVLRKLIDLEPDNLRVQIRLAELYQAIGQRKEAAQAFLNSAHRLLDRGDFLEAQKMADRALSADSKNTHAVMLKARALAALSKTKEAVALLESLPEAAAGTDATGLLIELYLQGGQSSRALGLARKIYARGPEHYGVVYDVAAALLDGGEADQALDLLGEIRQAMIEAGDNERLSQALSNAAERLPSRLEPLEWLVDLYRRTSDSFRLSRTLDQLGEAVVAAGQLERAREIFEELVEREPEDENNRRRLNQVRARLGMAPLEEVAAPPKVVVPEQTAVPFGAELEAAAPPPVPEVPLDAETEAYVAQALTDVDLFSSYGLTQKAIDLLENVLQRVPRHPATLEKLLDLHLGAGNDRRTAELAAQLEQVHRQRGDAASAERFAELSRRFQRAAGITAEEIAVPAQPPPPAEFTIPSVPVEPVPVVESAAAPVEVEARPAEAAVHEVDLSEEWMALSQQATEAPAAPPPEAAPTGEEVVQEIELGVEEEKAAPAVEPVLEVTPPTPAPEAPAAAEEEVVLAYDLELAAAEPVSKAAAEPGVSSDQFLSELAAEVEALELGPAAPKAAPPSPPPQAPAAQGETVEQLRQVFEEFRAELGEMGEEAEDLETHYNLGIAYREMGLLEEAIGEFQKVAKVVQAGRPFRYAMQCYTLLGLAFMDKGQPKIAAFWYDRALQTPALDQESILALRYDLGVAQEMAGDVTAALESFSQVYAMNIDYRDVAERISALQKRL